MSLLQKRFPSAQVQFGERMRFWRERAGLTQVQLATRLRYDNTMISRLESGRRPVSQDFARRADELLQAGGELTALAHAVFAERRGHPADLDPTDTLPLPGESHSTEPALLMWTRQLRERPAGVVCPLHGEVRCVDENSASALEVADLGGTVTVHGYLAWLAIYSRASLELTHAAMLVPPVERVARAVLDQAAGAPPTQRTALLHVAADYADLAGRLRGEVGQPATAMAWLHRGARWAATAGNPAALCRILTTMSLLARVEGDLGSAAGYAAAAGAADECRPWVIAHARLHQSRVSAVRGDRREFEQHVAVAGRLIDRFGERDRAEAPWLAGDEGSTFTHAFVAGGLRDLAARTGNRGLACRAVDAARTALDHLPPEMHPSRPLLTLRFADALARTGQRSDAIAAAATVLEQAVASGRYLVDLELRSLRSALAVCH